MKKNNFNVLRQQFSQTAQEDIDIPCSVNDLKRILGGEPIINDRGKLEYFSEKSIKPELKAQDSDAGKAGEFSDIRYFRIFPEQEIQNEDHKITWKITVNTLNDTITDNRRAADRIKNFIEDNINPMKNTINEVKKLQKIAGIIKESIYEQGEDESVQGLISQLKNKKYNTNLLFNADDIESQIYSDYDGEVSEEKVIEILNSIDTEPVWEVLTQQIDKAIQEKLPS